MRSIYSSCLAMGLCLSAVSYANPTFLPAEQAFEFSADSISNEKVQLSWKIAPHYYLYHDQFKVSINNDTKSKLTLNLPKGHQKDDPTFGLTEVHYDRVDATFLVQPHADYKVVWQGCSQDGLCYPLQSKILTTDAEGLLPQHNTVNTNQLSTLNQQGSNPSEKFNSEPQSTNSLNISEQDQNIETQNDHSQIEAQQSHQDNSTTSLQWNDDQSFFNLLSKDSLFFNLVIFFGLGILLAFLPCSLPLIPIISTLIIQRKTGYKALAVVSSFIVSMAVVYGLMGIFVAEIGYSFQRWFQSPIIVSLFALLFVIFAMNLFGLFQLSLPQRWINKLNHFQDRQKSGTLLGSMSMGALSALIVGPCMSAPLAGALLFVSQSHNAFLGGLYLFILGLGIGLPLFIASLFGSRLLPKPGQWMNHVKIGFGFMMLFMAVYFIRPMLTTEIYHYALALIALIAVLYIFSVIVKSQRLLQRLFIAIIGLAALFFSYTNMKQALEVNQIERLEATLQPWKTVTTQVDLNHALAEAKRLNKIAIVDVYADWCVSCQPIKNEVLPRVDVQNALKGFYLVKLDLSVQSKSQDLILKQHEILGPPTLLFFDQYTKESRKLRLTGRFKAEALIQHLDRFAE